METIARKIIEGIQNGKIKDKKDLERNKKRFCHDYNISNVFSNSDILFYATEEEKEEISNF